MPSFHSPTGAANGAQGSSDDLAERMQQDETAANEQLRAEQRARAAVDQDYADMMGLPGPDAASQPQLRALDVHRDLEHGHA